MSNFIEHYWFVIGWFIALAAYPLAYYLIHGRRRKGPPERKTINHDYRGRK